MTAQYYPMLRYLCHLEFLCNSLWIFGLVENGLLTCFTQLNPFYEISRCTGGLSVTVARNMSSPEIQSPPPLCLSFPGSQHPLMQSGSDPFRLPLGGAVELPPPSRPPSKTGGSLSGKLPLFPCLWTTCLGSGKGGASAWGSVSTPHPGPAGKSEACCGYHLRTCSFWCC